MAGCAGVFHAAASTSTNPAHESDVMRTNVEGTVAAIETAKKEGVKRFILTSTASVLGSSGATPLTEKSSRKEKFILAYERSKSLAENAVLSTTGRGIESIILRPTKVFGPGHTRNAYTADQVILQYMKRKWIVIPGKPVLINFAYIRDVVEGHYLALLHGKNRENYLLGGENKTYFEFFNSIRACHGSGNILRAPHMVFHLWGVLSEAWQKISGKRALFTPQTVDFLFSDHAFSSQKAINELGYEITPFEDAMRITVEYLQKNR
jgi:dihydroflavonol-4-reductase/farnesol dehydrogenase